MLPTSPCRPHVIEAIGRPVIIRRAARTRILFPTALQIVGALAGHPTTAVSQEEIPAEQQGAILNVVLDSLPYVIGRTWGIDEDRPYAVVLHTTAPQMGLLQRDFVRPATAAEHDHRWLEEQLSKPDVLGLCTELLRHMCERGAATVVATLSLPTQRDGRVVVEVEVRRRSGGPPGGRGAFVANCVLVLTKSEKGWGVVDFVLGGIT